ncbi:hypothetical protein J4H86_27060 [Spiractinospora alimapuensis]|nr:hypothetical protein J4H86_25985 [Spiractinospora alimapuensis]QVQ55186.1 hypothetical protein J4H86_27060 [Spiractinospora alimapuensis]
MLATGVTGAVVTWIGYRGTERILGERWRRENFQGVQVTLAEGTALSLGACVGAACAPGVPGRARLAGVLAAGSAAVLGAYDDAVGGRGARGFRGHLKALREGRLTSGTVKLFGIAAGSLGAAALVSTRPRDVAVNTILIAGSANLVNLLDLRPGRAAKAALLMGAPTLPGEGAAFSAAALGPVLAVLPADLHEDGMLGDGGANTIGALLGLSYAVGGTSRTRAVSAASLVVLTVASEAVSFSRVIDAVPPLRWLDRLGRGAEAGPETDARRP